MKEDNEEKTKERRREREKVREGRSRAEAAEDEGISFSSVVLLLRRVMRLMNFSFKRERGTLPYLINIWTWIVPEEIVWWERGIWEYSQNWYARPALVGLSSMGWGRSHTGRFAVYKFQELNSVHTSKNFSNSYSTHKQNMVICAQTLQDGWDELPLANNNALCKSRVNCGLKDSPPASFHHQHCFMKLWILLTRVPPPSQVDNHEIKTQLFDSKVHHIYYRRVITNIWHYGLDILVPTHTCRYQYYFNSCSQCRYSILTTNLKKMYTYNDYYLFIYLYSKR